MQTALGVNGDQEIALLRQRLGAKLSGRHLDVLLLHRRHHIRSRQTAGRDLIGIQPDAHRIFTGAKIWIWPTPGRRASSSFTFSVA